MSESSKSLQHVKTFPVVRQTHEFLGQLPATRVFAATTKPVLRSMVDSRPAQWVSPAARMLDSVAERGLELTETWVPSVKSKTYQDLGRDALVPFSYTKDAVSRATNATLEAADSYLYEPTHSQVLRFRQFYNANIYDTHGKPLLRSSVDPLVAPCNHRLETMADSYFPGGDQVASNGYSCELSRTLALSSNFAHRAAPYVRSKLVAIAMAPYNCTSHVNRVFNSHLDKHDNLSLANSWAASRDSMLELNRETMQYVKNKGIKADPTVVAD